jgi:multicomponent K+:H+ antiporter subunit E
MTLRRILPHPWLSLLIVVVWVLLANGPSAGALAMGIVLGITVPILTSRLWPNRPRLRNLPMIVEYGLVVLWDIVVANFEVAWIVLTKPSRDLRPAFMTVPLDLSTPEAITALACTITMTPGTLSSDLSADGRALLVHGLDVPDPPAAVARIKERYERRLKEILE